MNPSELQSSRNDNLSATPGPSGLQSSTNNILSATPGPSGLQRFRDIPTANPGPSRSQIFENIPTAQHQDEAEESDMDEYCRLRHGLNTYCLAESFQFLNDEDLTRLGTMNKYYSQIINNFVIPDHVIIFDYLNYKQYGEILLQKHGKKIKRFQFIGKLRRHYQSFQQRIVEHCDIDQLRDIAYNIAELGRPDGVCVTVDVDIEHFRKVERFYFQGLGYKPTTLNLPQFESLRALDLYKVNMDPKFNWNTLINLTELSLARVKGINIKNFIQFIRLQPQLRRFVHLNTFQDIQRIGTELAKNCGNHMRIFRDIVDYEFVDGRIVYKTRNGETYRFLSDFVKLKEVLLVSDLMCVCDLQEPLTRLSQNDALEKLTIIQILSGQGNPMDCFVNNYISFDLKRFNRLKTIHVHVRGGPQSGMCNYLKLFNDYSAQIMTNVESIMMSGSNQHIYQMEFIKMAHNLRNLAIYNTNVPINEIDASVIISIIIGGIVQHQPHHSASAPLIKIIVNKSQWKEFQKLKNIDPHIKFEFKNPNVYEYPDVVQSFWHYSL